MRKGVMGSNFNKEKYIQTERGTVFYWITNKINDSKFAIVFCHGLTADHTLFDKQVEHLANMYTIITWDLPLHGKSRPYRDFSFENTSEDLLTILKQENIDKIVLVGQSAGGYIAQSFIKEYPEKVLGFVGIGTTPFGELYYKKSELFWIKHYSKIARLYPYRYYCKLGAKSITRTEEAKERMYRTLVHLGKRDMLKAASAFYGEFLKVKDEVDFQCPVLITYGEYDKTGYVKRYCDAWSEKTGYPLKVIRDASHNANDDNYDAFNQLLISFIKSLNNT